MEGIEGKKQIQEETKLRQQSFSAFRVCLTVEAGNEAHSLQTGIQI